MLLGGIMTKIGEMYKCEICGNIVSVIDVGGGTLVCCGQEMNLLEVKTEAQEGKEKHVPVLSIDGDKVTVKVGSVEHPMEDNHYIQLIQVVKDGLVIACKRLKPGQKPEATFYLEDTEGLKARELCTIHGLWTN